MTTDKLKTSHFPTSELIPDAHNLRLHPARNHDALLASIKAFGIRKPIVAHAESKVVYAGNETLACAVELGIAEIPVAWIPKDVPEIECRAYAVADNRTTDLSAFNPNALGDFLVELPELGIDTELVGFSEEEVEGLTGQFDIDGVEYPT